MSRACTIIVRVTEKQREELEVLSNEQGMRLSDYVRTQLFGNSALADCPRRVRSYGISDADIADCEALGW